MGHTQLKKNRPKEKYKFFFNKVLENIADKNIDLTAAL